MIVVQVILPIPINKSFKYRMYHSMKPIIGSRVLVPFRSKEMIGIVISFLKENDTDQSKLLYVKKVIDLNPLYTDCLIKMLLWIVKYYYLPIGNLFFSILPKLIRNDQIIQKKYFIQKWKITEKGKNLDLYTLKNQQKQCYVLSFLKKKVYCMRN